MTKMYNIVSELSNQYPVRTICMTLALSFSSFYSWKRSESYVLSETKQKHAKKVKEVFDEHRKRYGAIRISKELQSQGYKIGRYQTQALMKKQGLVAIQPKSFVPKTTDSNHSLGRSPNLLLDKEAPKKPNEVFVGDITYIAMTDGSWLYLAVWQDMFSRKIVGWDLADHMRSELVINAFKKAIQARNLPKWLIVHSDGGGQYASVEMRKLLKDEGFCQSMTRKDNHYDNAMAESLFSRFKAELMQKGTFLSFADAYTEIFEFIEIYYNKKRRHSSINYEIPEVFEAKFES
jgi:putative transposase